ncbi:hypothetical protein YYG_02894 [Plasmodium vinckei petteri]|uniref:Uncharacterized protein n=1 Tax=Plasmodium vinckei petteri TaxID=138298 RepID=W7ALK7_PLAVN|nr:hypothetical protein YYG_02894 [Plasmodium vinckei petteri]CAD2103334.1 conserved Plasmodium protein, unknown function [Plasmodium vinckei petteri]
MDANSNENTHENVQLNNSQNFHPTGEINSNINEPLNNSTPLNNNETVNIEINTNNQTSENMAVEGNPTRTSGSRNNRRRNGVSLLSMVAGIIINQLTGYQPPDVPSYLLANNNMSMATRLNMGYNAIRGLTENNTLGTNQRQVTETPSLTYPLETQNNNESEFSDIPNYVNKRRNNNSSESTAENSTENASENVSRNATENSEEDLIDLLPISAREYLSTLENNLDYINQLNQANLRGASTLGNQERCVGNNEFAELSRILDGDYAYDHDTDRFVYTHLPEYNDIELTPISSLTLSRSLYDDYDSAVFADKYLIEHRGTLNDPTDSDEYDNEQEYEMIEARRNLNTNRVPISDIYRRGRFTIQDHLSNNMSRNYSNIYDGDIFFYNDREYDIRGGSSNSNQYSYNNRNYGNNIYGIEEEEEEDEDEDDNDIYRTLQFSYSRPGNSTYRSNRAFSLNDSLNYDSLYDDYDDDDDDMDESVNSYPSPSMSYETLYRNSMVLRRSPTEELDSDDTTQDIFSLNDSSSNNTPLNNSDVNNDTPVNRDLFDDIDLDDEPTDNINFGELRFNNTTINGTSFNDDIFTRDSSRNLPYETLRSRDIFSNEDSSDDDESNPSMSTSTSKALYGSDDEYRSAIHDLLNEKLNSQYSDDESDISEYFDAVSTCDYNSEEEYFSSADDNEFNEDEELEPMPSSSTSTPRSRSRAHGATSLVKEGHREAESYTRENARYSYLYSEDDDDY